MNQPLTLCDDSLLTTIVRVVRLRASHLGLRVKMKPKKHNVAFGRVLAALRRVAGWSQESLGFEAGLDRSYISLLERGKRSPTLDTIARLALVLGVSPTHFIYLVEKEMNKPNEKSDQTP